MNYTKRGFKYNDEGRECSKCSVFKPWEDFHNWKHGLNKRDSGCKDCKLIYQRVLKYNISEEELKELMKTKGCEICGEEFTDSKFTHIDHCHETNEVRGILCSNCNTGLGKFKDNPDLLYNAIKYIKK